MDFCYSQSGGDRPLPEYLWEGYSNFSPLFDYCMYTDTKRDIEVLHLTRVYADRGINPSVLLYVRQITNART